MTIGPRELPSRRGHRAGRAGQAAAELEPLVDGPVHPPYTVDAAVELAVDPLVGALPRLLAVVGATSTEDVAAAVSWATAHGVGVVALDPRAHRPTLPAGDGRPRPVLAISRGRLDRVTVDREDRTLRAGVGASWAACHRTAAADGPGPRALLHRPGLVAHGVGSVTKRGVVLVTGDGTVHRLGAGAGAGDADLWWAYRARPDRVGVLTEVVLDPWDTATLQRRPAWSAGDRMRFADLMRRHDPDGTLTRSVGQSG